MGTDQSWAITRSKIWSTTVQYGPPTLWITINPSDLHDPIAQVFAGEDINMDAFNELSGVSAVKCTENIAKDPYMAVKFFHFMVQLIFQSLFGIDSSRQQILSTISLFGEVVAYIRVIKLQNRGTLHLHMLMWLKEAPPADEMWKLLKLESFREQIRTFIPVLLVYAHCNHDTKLLTNSDVTMKVAWYIKICHQMSAKMFKYLCPSC